MTDAKFCQNCGQQHSCQEIYQQLGRAQGPSVALKAAIAFLLPIVVFIAVLAVILVIHGRYGS